MVKKPPTINELLLDRAIDRALTLERLTRGEAEKVRAFLAREVFPDIVDQVRTKLAKMERGGVPSLGQKRLKFLLDAIEDLVGDAQSEVRRSIEKVMVQVGKAEAKWQLGSLVKVVPDELDLDFLMPSPSTLREAVVGRPIDGRFLRDWAEKWGADTRGRLAQAINLGMVEGQSIDQITRRIRGTRDNDYTDGILGGASARDARTMARTAVRNASTAAREAVYEANDDVIAGVMYVATLDDRTTLICADLHGNVYPIGEGPRPPQHPNCRSDTTPVLKSFRELGFDRDEIPDGVVASMDGEIADPESYDAWLRAKERKTPGFADEKFGSKMAARLWRSREATLGELLGEDLMPLTIEELIKKFGEG